MECSASPLKGKHVIVGISGGIAAYKAPLLVRLLVKAGAEVICAATEHALQFVTPLTLATVSNHPVYSQLFDLQNRHSTEHIALKEWGDLLILAPATANIIGKAASGIGDDALSTLLLSFRKPLYICPAMNTEMLASPAVQRNMEYLRQCGAHFIDSATGSLACGTEGKGRMEEPEEIVHQVEVSMAQRSDLAGRTILITAGPTYERIDAVRFVGNFSTGKMGFAIAEECAVRGAKVILVAGPTHLTAHHANIERIDILSAREMYDAVHAHFKDCDIAILAAAVADFRPDKEFDYKLKKQGNDDTLTLHLVQNPDILASLGASKQPHQRLVGFALETDNEETNARKKLEKKNLDLIILNSLHDAGAGFGYDTNKVTFMDREGHIDHGSLKSKREVAADIVDRILQL